MSTLKPTLEHMDYRVKVDTYFQYAPLDNATVCQVKHHPKPPLIIMTSVRPTKIASPSLSKVRRSLSLAAMTFNTSNSGSVCYAAYLPIFHHSYQLTYIRARVLRGIISSPHPATAVFRNHSQPRRRPTMISTPAAHFAILPDMNLISNAWWCSTGDSSHWWKFVLCYLSPSSHKSCTSVSRKYHENQDSRLQELILWMHTV